MKVWNRVVLTAAMAAGLGLSMPVYGAAMPDAWITTKVKMALLTTEGVSSNAVNVDTIDGRVTLHGTVSSAQEKAAAAQAARTVEGVKDLRDLLVVVAPAHQDAVAVADDQIQKNVTAALDHDATLKDSSIKVASVNNGVVVLSGNATTLTDQLRALETARAVPGVRKVASEITGPDKLTDAEIWNDTTTTVKQTGAATGNAVKDAGATVATGVTDAWITSAAKVRLIANSVTPALDINVDTRNGAVTLFGMVPTDEAKRAAEAEVKQVSGVKSVDNELRVVAESRQERVEAKDDDVKARVAKALDDHDDVTVAVSDGVVRLTGSVDNQSERLQVLTTARATPGVRSVIDGLQLNDRHAAADR